MYRSTIFLCLLCSLPTIAPAQDAGRPAATMTPEPEQVSITEDLEVVQLTDTVWRHVSYYVLERFGRSPGNGLIVVSGETAALIDTPWTADQTRDLFRWADEELGVEISVVIATHSHQDCAGGLAAAHQLGARTYASKKTAKLLRRAGQPAPRSTFRRRHEVAVGSRTLELHAAGPGHTIDNIVVWIPDQEILFGGCAVRSGRSTQLGYTDEADLERWPRTIETLLEDYGGARWIVPGHGSPGDAELLRHTLELLESSDG